MSKTVHRKIQVLKSMIPLLEERWGKGSYFGKIDRCYEREDENIGPHADCDVDDPRKADCMCLLGAAWAAAYDYEPVDGTRFDEQYPTVRGRLTRASIVDALYEALPAEAQELPPWAGQYPEEQRKAICIERYNDTDETTKRQVITLVRRAIDRLEGRT